jgi:hypothetical protein
MSDIPLEKHIESRIDGAIVLVEARFVAAEKAIMLAKEDIDRRLDAMNELRAQITLERTEFVTRAWYTQAHDALEERLRTVEQFKSNIDGKIYMLGGLLIIMQIGLAAIVHFWPHTPK